MAAFRGSRSYPEKEPKKPRRVTPSTSYLKEEKPSCKFDIKDICPRCIDVAQYVNIVSLGEHYECPSCKWRCSCLKK